MTRSHRLYVGTIGEGLFRSLDGGRTFSRACEGMFVECHVRALAVHPRRPEVLHLGSEQGLFVSTDGADSWQRLDAPLSGMQVWSLCVPTVDPDVLLVGTCPSRIFRSADGGKSWTEATTRMVQGCPRILHTRVTCLTCDPQDPDRLWAGVEIDGVHGSRDRGRTWQPLAGTGLSSRDIHALAVLPGQGLLATTNNDLNDSRDGGATWQPLRASQSLPWSYFRGLAPRCGRPEVLFAGHGDFPPGTAGAVLRSRDAGATWQVLDLPGPVNSTIWNFATHETDPDLVYASSVSGQVFRTRDGGETWEKLKREFGEIRALAWTP